MRVKIKDINVPVRFRKAYKDVDQLAASFEEFGQLQPIVLLEDSTLCAGGRRLAAANHLGWTEIEAVVKGQQGDELRLREIELEENIQREDMTWQERTSLVAEIDKLKREKYGDHDGSKKSSGWTFGKTAELLKQSASTVSQDVRLAKAMKEIPDLANADSKTDAIKTLNKMIEQMALEELTKRRAARSGNEAEVSQFDQLVSSYKIGDCLEGMKAVPDNANFIMAEVDPPYGIDLPKVRASTVDDSYIEVQKEHYPAFVLNVAKEVYRLLAPNAWCVWWTSFDHVVTTALALAKAGFKYDAVPAVWIKDRGQTNHPNTCLAKGWEFFYLARKGKPIMHKQGHLNVFPFKGVTERIHPTERPVPLIEEIMRTLLQDGHGDILCPFLGSGNTIIASHKLGHKCVGWDIEGDFTRSQFQARVVDLIGLAELAEGESNGNQTQQTGTG